MFDFKKTKTSDKVLSEQEIQQKLYGRFLSNKNQVAGGSEVFPKQTSKNASTSSTALLFPEETKTEQCLDIQGPELIPEPRPAIKKEDRVASPEASVPHEGLRERLQSSEGDRSRSNWNQPKTSRISFQKNIPKLKVPKISLQPMLNTLSNTAAIFFRSVFGFLFAIGRVIDFRKDSVRTGFTWGAGVILLVLLLAAIHGLNSKREVAMQSAVPKAPKKIAIKEKSKSAVSPTVNSSVGQNATTDIAGSNTMPLTPVQADVAIPKKDTAKSLSKGRFVIQVATYVIRDDAERLLKDLQKVDSNSFVKGLSRSSGKTYYSVFLGRFKDFQTSQQALAEFKKTDFSRSFKDAFIRTLEA